MKITAMVTVLAFCVSAIAALTLDEVGVDVELETSKHLKITACS